MSNALETICPMFDTDTLPTLGPERRPGTKPLSEIENDLTLTLATVDLTDELMNLVRSTVLLWHDHLDESHTVSQDIKSPDGSFVHGIMHRREPDYSNAKYWFNRVGSHPTFPEISNRIFKLLANSSLARLTEGDWDSFAMVDAVATARDGSEEYNLLQQVQQIEFEVLVEWFCV